MQDAAVTKSVIVVVFFFGKWVFESILFSLTLWSINSDQEKSYQWIPCQHAKKVVSDSPRLVDLVDLVNFAIGLVNSVFNLPDGQVMFFEEFE